MEFEPRLLEDDEVEVEVHTCGICGTDVHQLTNGWKRATFPLIPGHEFIGTITKLGKDVKHLTLGQRVGVCPVCRSCGSCDHCNSSHGQLCFNKVTTYNGQYKGHTTYGGYANKVRLQAAWAIPIPDNIEDESAPLLCAGITTYLPFKHQNINESTSVGVVGIGGLGHLALQWARAKKCKRVIAFSTSLKKKEEAKQLGATDFAVLSDDMASFIQSVDVLLVCGSGKSTDWGQLLSVIKLRGKLVLLDIPEENISIPSASFIYKHIQIVGSFIGSNDDVKEMLQFASETGVRPWVQTVGNSLEEVNKGVELLMNGKAHYRIVITGKGRYKD
ncbi:alcohol dehydrogenase-like protein [Pilobolus umbonatus]|nr:alcohol dehydrogenase-like protein [Pilobolus umbonatus]